MSEVFEIRLPGRVDSLPTLRAFFGSLVETLPGLPLTEKETTEIQLVLQEACINSIRHASTTEEPVRVAFFIGEDALTIEVADRGPGFDPGEVPPPRAEALQEGGYGVFIMKRSMDRLETRRENGCFVLSLTKRYRALASGAGMEGR